MSSTFGPALRALSAGLAILMSASAAVAAPSPLLDRTLFLAEPEITGAQLSPGGGFLAFTKMAGAGQGLFIKRTGGPLAQAWRVTSGGAPDAVYWSRDGRYLLFTRDETGHGKPGGEWGLTPFLPFRTHHARNIAMCVAPAVDGSPFGNSPP